MEELIYEFKYLILLLNIFRKEMKLFIKVKDMKTFWQEFGEEVTFHSHAYQTQKKPKQFLKNWRPISLFNVLHVYKIAYNCFISLWTS